MRRTSLPWVKMPSWWIEKENLLLDFSWGRSGSANLAALMTLTLILHRSKSDNTAVRITLDDFMETICISRAKLLEGLAVLEEKNLIERPERSHYHVIGMDERAGWSKFPCQKMYVPKGRYIKLFKSFNKRHRSELHALKLLFLISARLDSQTGRATINVSTISRRSGIPENEVKKAMSHLISNDLIHAERVVYKETGKWFQGYRLAGIKPKIHSATVSPADWDDFLDLDL